MTASQREIVGWCFQFQKANYSIFMWQCFYQDFMNVHRLVLGLFLMGFMTNSAQGIKVVAL